MAPFLSQGGEEVHGELLHGDTDHDEAEEAHGEEGPVVELCVDGEVADLGGDLEEEAHDDEDDAGVFGDAVEFGVGILDGFLWAEDLSHEMGTGLEGDAVEDEDVGHAAEDIEGEAAVFDEWLGAEDVEVAEEGVDHRADPEQDDDGIEHDHRATGEDQPDQVSGQAEAEIFGGGTAHGGQNLSRNPVVWASGDGCWRRFGPSTP